ncbi:MAG: hypothetical protein AAB091_05235, partial [Elusimicrobiota bacterium]
TTARTTQTKITLDNLIAARYHTVRVKAINRRGIETAYTVLGSTTTIENTPPQQPLGLDGVWADRFTLKWAAVAYDADGAVNKDLMAYLIYRSTSVDGPYSLVATLSPSTTSWTDSDSFRYTIYFYKVRAIDTNQNLGEFSSSLVSTLDFKSQIDAGDGGLSIVLPSRLLTKNGSGANEAITVVIERKPEEEGARVLTSYKLTAITLSGKTLTGFQFAQPIEMRFKIPVLGASSSTFSALATVLPSEIANTAVFHNNGAEWIRLDGRLNETEKNLTSWDRRTGPYALRQSLGTTEFTILSIEPRKFITPEGQYPYNQFTVRFSNPRDSQLNDARIFNLEGAAMAEFTRGADGSSYYWNGRDYEGVIVPSGVYLYQIKIEGKVFNGTVVVAR